MGWKAAVLCSGEAGLLGEGKDCPPCGGPLRAGRQGNLSSVSAAVQRHFSKSPCLREEFPEGQVGCHSLARRRRFDVSYLRGIRLPGHREGSLFSRMIGLVRMLLRWVSLAHALFLSPRPKEVGDRRGHASFWMGPRVRYTAPSPFR